MEGYIAVDFDGTLAEYHGWKGEDHLGAPVQVMVERVKAWLADGKKVKIFTARTENHIGIMTWCQEHLGQVLEITNTKDYGMVTLYDDRAVQVELNTGRLIQ